MVGVMPRNLFVALLSLLLAPLMRGQATVALPFTNLSRDANLEWIGEAAAENILESVHAEGLLTLDRAARAHAMQRLALPANVLLSRASILRIADELEAAFAVFGEYEVAKPSGEKASIKLRARVMDRKRLHQSAELAEEGLLDDLATLQSRMAWKVLAAITPTSTGKLEDYLARRKNVRADAIESYVRGLLAKESAAKHRYFTQSARLDPEYSQPCFQLGLHYWDKEDYQQASQWFLRVSRQDAHYMEAAFYYGISRHYLGDYPAAEAAFLTVSSSVPLNEVFSNLGAAQVRQAKYEAAISNFEKALDGDPADPDFHFNLAYALWRAKRFDDAANQFRAVLERIPDDADATALLGLCLRNQTLRAGESKYEGLERIKEEYEETVFRQLKSLVDKK